MRKVGSHAFNETVDDGIPLGISGTKHQPGGRAGTPARNENAHRAGRYHGTVGARSGPVLAAPGGAVDRESLEILETRPVIGRRLEQVRRTQPAAPGPHPRDARSARAVRRSRTGRDHSPAGPGRPRRRVRGPGHPLAGLWRRPRRRTAARAYGVKKDRRRDRPSGRRCNPRATRRPGSGSGPRVAVCATVGGERLSGDRARADRSYPGEAERPCQPDQPRVSLSLRLRVGTAPDRL